MTVLRSVTTSKAFLWVTQRLQLWPSLSVLVLYLESSPSMAEGDAQILDMKQWIQSAF